MVEKESLCFSFSAVSAIVGAVLTWASLMVREVFYKYCKLAYSTIGATGWSWDTCLLDVDLAMIIGLLLLIFGAFYASRTYHRM